MPRDEIKEAPERRDVVEDDGLAVGPGPVPHVFDGAGDTEPFFVQLGFVANQENFNAWNEMKPLFITLEIMNAFQFS